LFVLPRPEGITKLARTRLINSAGVGPFETPMLVPSFSSKGFPKLSHLIQNTEPYIFGPALFSAYDYSHGFLPEDINFPSLIFLDSGGYEAQKEADLSAYFDSIDSEYEPKGWSEQLFERVVAEFQPLAPLVHVSYDHPNRRLPLVEQLDAGLKFGGASKQLCRELLIKPTTKSQTFLEFDDILPHVKKLSPFAVVGVTEKELGSSLLDRMVAVGRLRLAMKRANLDSMPIHVFGSLDTFSTLLYFVMGADIFDGLTWLRYGYDRGRTVYRHEFAALQFAPNKKTKNADEDCLRSNYNYLQEMELQMRAYITTGEFGSFEYNSDTVEKLAVHAWGRLD
jgi:hypothetical protein